MRCEHGTTDAKSLSHCHPRDDRFSNKLTDTPRGCAATNSPSAPRSCQEPQAHHSSRNLLDTELDLGACALPTPLLQDTLILVGGSRRSRRAEDPRRTPWPGSGGQCGALGTSGNRLLTGAPPKPHLHGSLPSRGPTHRQSWCSSHLVAVRKAVSGCRGESVVHSHGGPVLCEQQGSRHKLKTVTAAPGERQQEVGRRGERQGQGNSAAGRGQVRRHSRCSGAGSHCGGDSGVCTWPGSRTW